MVHGFDTKQISNSRITFTCNSMDFDHNLETVLGKLFDKAGEWEVSIELIQKLAQHLKFETFIDENASSHVTDSTVDTKFQRLTIAGTRILVDIDHTNDKNVIKVSVSVGDNVAGGNSKYKLQDYIIDSSDSDNIKLINIDFTKENIYAIVRTGEGTISGTDKLLYNNLITNGKLNSFPANLKYINSLDRLSSSTFDLVSYISNLGLLLKVIHKIETDLRPEDWLIESGLSNRIGLPITNDFDSNKLGIFLDFWQDFRYMNHELPPETKERKGETYKILLSINDSTKKQNADYLEESRFKNWCLLDANDNFTKYRFVFQEGKNLGGGSTDDDEKKWSVYLNFNHPILLPVHLLELLGVTNYESHTTNTDVAKALEQGFHITTTVKEVDMKFSFSQQVSQEIVLVTSIELMAINDLAKLVPICRNYLVLTNIIRLSLRHQKAENKGNEEMFSPELSLEARNKLKETLRLPEDVTDAELLGLSTVSDNFESTQFNGGELDDFMNNEGNPVEEKPTPEPEKTKKPFILLTVDDIDYDSLNTDLLVSFDGYVDNMDIQFNFKVSNGEIVLVNSEDVDMDGAADKDTPLKTLIKALNITEDIIKSVEYI